MGDGVYITNKNHEFLLINSKLVDDFGPVEGKKCYEYIHERDKPCPWCKNEQVFQGKTIRWQKTLEKQNILYKKLPQQPFFTILG